MEILFIVPASTSTAEASIDITLIGTVFSNTDLLEEIAFNDGMRKEWASCHASTLFRLLI